MLKKNIFNDLFCLEANVSYDVYYKFFYIRTSPRGNSKFGITDIPWQRVRMQQQGTDEIIQLDRLWFIKVDSRDKIAEIENALKDHYKDKCLATQNRRAGHTEWFRDVDVNIFNNQINDLCETLEVKIQEVPINGGYLATNKSQCPFNFPASFDYSWFSNFWKQLETNTVKIKNPPTNISNFLFSNKNDQ